MSMPAADAALARDEVIAEVERVARETFGYEELRPGQAEAMASLLEGHDVLLVMPTGAGKSAVYQVPAVILHGATVVVSPLIALQRDQVDSLREHGEETKAYAVSSAVAARERREAWEAVSEGEAEFLFLAPEQLANPDVLERVRELAPSIVAVDEAHAVSAWGHDFRPDYLRLGDFIDAIGHPRVVALTATAAPPVREDIMERLHMRNPELIVKGFSRPNIALEVVRVMTDADKREAVLLRAASEPKPAVVYTGTRRDAEEYAAALAELSLRAEAYHGGMRAADRDAVQERFMGDELDVIVATNAFGMGIDKSDIRTVIHATVPDSPDSYYQEIGRAGRDGEPSLAVLFYRPEDLGMRKFFASGIPDPEVVAEVAKALDDASVDADDADRREIAEATGLGPRKLGRILNLLDGVDGEDLENPRAAAEQAVQAAESQRKLEQSRIEMMRGFCETQGCRRQFLLAYFAERLPEPCGNCDTCRAGTAEAAPDVDEAPFPLQSRVRHTQFGEGVVMSYETDPDRVTVLFEESGYRTLALHAVQRNNLLEQVG
jgi:ATP-dependent DNA helicase RecQ